MRGAAAQRSVEAVGCWVQGIDISHLREGNVLNPIDLVRLLGVGTHDTLFRPRALELRARIEKELNLVSRFRKGQLVLLHPSERTDYGVHQAKLGVKRLGRNATRLQTTVTDGMDEGQRRRHESASVSVSMAHTAARRAISRKAKTDALAVKLADD